MGFGLFFCHSGCAIPFDTRVELSGLLEMYRFRIPFPKYFSFSFGIFFPRHGADIQGEDVCSLFKPPSPFTPPRPIFIRPFLAYMSIGKSNPFLSYPTDPVWRSRWQDTKLRTKSTSTRFEIDIDTCSMHSFQWSPVRYNNVRYNNIQ